MTNRARGIKRFLSLARWHFVFLGRTKKIAYASGLDGVRVLPVQGLTALLYVATGLLGF